jgi:hypothetical protein
MIMHKMTEELEKGLPPDPATLERVGKLIQESLEQKIFVSGEGLRPTSQRMHLSYENGKRTITNGPFAQAKELIGGFALLKVSSREEGLSWLDKFAAVVGDVELFLGTVVEPWDLGMMPKPANAPLRFLSLQQLDEHRESTIDPAVAMRLAALFDEMTKAGVLQASSMLEGTKKGARVHFEGNKRSVIDGPFAESKELIAGYAILELPSKAAAIDFAKRFGEVVQVNEVEIRQIAG